MSKKMKRSLVMLLLVTMVFSIVGCGKKAEEKAYEVNIALQSSPTNPMTTTVIELGKQLDAKSNGRIKTNVFPAGQICGSEREIAEKLSQNIVQFATIATFTIGPVSGTREYNVFDIPYMFRSAKEVDDFLDSDFFMAYRKNVEQKLGAKTYGGWLMGFMMIGSNKNPLESPEGVKGIKLRCQTSQPVIKMVEAWDASPTPMAFGEVFTALQQGIIDAMLAPSLVIYDEGFYEALKYVADVDGNMNYQQTMVNQEWYNSLPDDLKAIFDECVNDYLDNVRTVMADNDKYGKDQMKAAGKFIYLTDEQREEWVKPVKPVKDELGKELVGEEFYNQASEWIERYRASK